MQSRSGLNGRLNEWKHCVPYSGDGKLCQDQQNALLVINEIVLILLNERVFNNCRYHAQPQVNVSLCSSRFLYLLGSRFSGLAKR